VRNWEHKGFAFLLQRRIRDQRYAYIVVRAHAKRKEIGDERAELSVRLGAMADDAA
jgi:hypothetical protein